MQRSAAVAFKTTSTVFFTIFDEAGAGWCLLVVPSHVIYWISFNSKCRQSKEHTQSSIHFTLHFSPLWQNGKKTKKNLVPFTLYAPFFFCKKIYNCDIQISKGCDPKYDFRYLVWFNLVWSNLVEGLNAFQPHQSGWWGSPTLRFDLPLNAIVTSSMQSSLYGWKSI